MNAYSIVGPYNVIADYTTVSHCFTLPSIFCIIPRRDANNEEVVGKLICAALLCQYRLYGIINTKNKVRITVPTEIGAHITTYASISFSSTLYSDSSRVAYSNKLKLFA